MIGTVTVLSGLPMRSYQEGSKCKTNNDCFFHGLKFISV